MTVRIGYIVGSLAAQSINRRLAEYVVERAPAEVQISEIPIGGLPLYTYDLDECFPPAATSFKDAVESSDVILFVTPEYNRSIPAALKNALEWGSRPWGRSVWSGRSAAIVGTGLNGAGTAVAQAQLRGILGHLGMVTLGAPEVCVPWTEGVLDSAVTAGLIDELWQHLAASARRPAAA